METVEFNTKVGEKELFHFLMQHFYMSFSGIFGLILSLGAFILFIFSIGNGEKLQLILLLVMSLLFTVVQPLQLKIKAKQQAKKNPVFQESLHYLVNDKGITLSQKQEKATLEWNAIRKVVETKKAFFVYMTVINANILPKDQIGDMADPLRELLKENLDKSICKLH